MCTAALQQHSDPIHMVLMLPEYGQFSDAKIDTSLLENMVKLCTCGPLWLAYVPNTCICLGCSHTGMLHLKKTPLSFVGSWENKEEEMSSAPSSN